MIVPSIHKILSTTPNPVVFELGACDAKYTHSLFMACKDDPIYYAFEPDPRNVPICLERMPPLVKFFPHAIGNVTGEAELHLASPQPNGEIGSSSLSPFKDLSKAFDWCKLEGHATVRSWRLDDFCAEYKVDKIDLIFMDIQGAECLMIEGAQETLKRTHYLWTEFEGVETAGTLYEHSRSLRQLESMLPDWKTLEIHGGDALLENKACLK